MVTAPAALRARYARRWNVLAPLAVVTAFAGRLVQPHRAAIANLRAIPLTVAGALCIDFAAFHVAHGWGWLVTGLSLVLLEHLIADE
jgi:hypothetical protein